MAAPGPDEVDPQADHHRRRHLGAFPKDWGSPIIATSHSFWHQPLPSFGLHTTSKLERYAQQQAP